MTTEENKPILQLVAIKFRSAGKLYDFLADGLDLSKGDQVIVETERGKALGTVVNPPRLIAAAEVAEEMKRVVRKATEADIGTALTNKTREMEAHRFCRQRIRERNMEMKLVQAEYLYDGSKIIFYFTADGRVDFRDLVKDLAQQFHTRIEMRQIGVRDEAKMVGGLGVCGRELCCCSFLRKFEPVSVKMAKEQGLALNPNKISGQCGRLLCCLGYEFKTYCSMRKKLPKCGCKVEHGGGTAEVVSQDVLAQRLTLRTGSGEYVKVALSDLGQAAPKAEPAEQKDAAAAETAPEAARDEKKERRQRPLRPRLGRDRKKPAEAKVEESGARPPSPEPRPPKSPQPQSVPAAPEADKDTTKTRRRRPRRRKPRTES